ncbi:HlyD family secretion protein [Pukyongiella litopenaei]|uniref:HlyD family secretion protein n=1 Tax=Pukyongiella litopenaei TaxID=2605946 RepID=A0A2S0MT71_9RHOB|nr:biotin/lipoyl-binding protein [Pukyongiella litopenaei]AVO39007.1 HlyD family secretion protein [Pukyongiella litopenaei]
MFEFTLCSMLTILPDYLFRRYVQDKRIGREITFFSVWYELRWGISSCAILTISLIALIFFYHPATNNIGSFFRTLTLLPETGGRVAEVLVENNQHVEAGQVLFRIDDASQRAAVETARMQVAEVEASLAVARADLDAAEGQVAQARAALAQARDQFERQSTLLTTGSAAARESEVERYQNLVNQRTGEVDAALANKVAVEENINTLIPARRSSAEAALAQAEAELNKTVIKAGVDGRLDQFALQVGDYVNPILRPAGILVPSEFEERDRFVAGFGQLSASVIKPGMFAEMGCLARPFKVVPMVVVEVQDVIPSGQFRPTDRLIDPADITRPGMLTVFLEPLYKGQADPLPPGSTCFANVYTNNHDRLENDDSLGTGQRIFLHVVDTVGLVHAILLRAKLLLLPVKLLVFSGH